MLASVKIELMKVVNIGNEQIEVNIQMRRNMLLL